MLIIELKAAASGQPGYGTLQVQGWTGDMQGLELSIQRNQDGRHLDAAGGWDSQPVWHLLESVSPAGPLLEAAVGPWLVDPLLQSPQMMYRLQLRAPEGQQDLGILKMASTLLSSRAAGNSLHEEARVRPPEPAMAPPAEPEPEPEQVQPVAPEQEPLAAEPAAPEGLVAEPREPAPVARPCRSRFWLWLGLLILLLALAGAAGWWFMLRDRVAPAVTRPAAPLEHPQTAGAEPAACSAAMLGSQTDDLVFIQSCLKTRPDSRQLLELIATARQARRCGVVQRLYAHQAQAGDAAIALAYAREYDPQTFQAGGCIPAADAETAQYWYEIAVANDPANQAASQRLAQLKKEGGQP